MKTIDEIIKENQDIVYEWLDETSLDIISKGYQPHEVSLESHCSIGVPHYKFIAFNNKVLAEAKQEIEMDPPSIRWNFRRYY